MKFTPKVITAVLLNAVSCVAVFLVFDFVIFPTTPHTPLWGYALAALVAAEWSLVLQQHKYLRSDPYWVWAKLTKWIKKRGFTNAEAYVIDEEEEGLPTRKVLYICFSSPDGDVVADTIRFLDKLRASVPVKLVAKQLAPQTYLRVVK